MSSHLTRKAVVWTLLMVSLALCAFAAPASARSGPAGMNGMPPAAMLLQQMHMANLVQIKAAKIARQKAGNDLTWHFADRLWRDHQVADGKVRMLAGKLGFQLKSPAQMQQMMRNMQPAQVSAMGAPQKMQQKMQMMQAMMAKLQATPAPQFDQVYVKVMLKSQQNMLHLLQQAQTQAKPPVRKLVTVLIPILAQHVALAQSLAGMTPAARSGVEENSR